MIFVVKWSLYCLFILTHVQADVYLLFFQMPRVQTSRLGKNPIEVDSDGGEDLHVDYEVGNDVSYILNFYYCIMLFKFTFNLVLHYFSFF